MLQMPKHKQGGFIFYYSLFTVHYSLFTDLHQPNPILPIRFFPLHFYFLLCDGID